MSNGQLLTNLEPERKNQDRYDDVNIELRNLGCLMNNMLIYYFHLTIYIINVSSYG